MKQVILLNILLFQCVINAAAQTPKGAEIISTKPAFRGNTYAIIIGISKYQSSAIPQLNYADSDAIAFHDFLTSAIGGSVPEKNIKMLLNDKACLGDIMNIGFPFLEANVKKGDRVFIYFSGHGVTIGNNDSYLLAYDIKEGFNKHNIFFMGGVPLLQLKRNEIQDMTKAGIEVFLIIDACRSRAIENVSDSIKLLSTSVMSENAGDIMLLAAENEQCSQEDAPGNKKWGGHGVFTYYLLNGLNGMAYGMGGQDGIITLGELKNYLNKEVPEATGYRQVPFVSEGLSQVPLSKVDTSTLAALKQKLSQPNMDLAFAPTTSKGVTSSGADSTAKYIYARFVHSLKTKKLIGDSSADYYFKQLENYSRGGNNESSTDDYSVLLENNSLVGNLLQNALYSLCAAFQNNGQKIINAYLNSDMKILLNGNIYNNTNAELTFEQGELLMKRLYDYREKYYYHTKYNEDIKARWLFFKARKWTYSNDIMKLKEAEKTIKKAIMIDSNQFYFHYTLALIYENEHKYEPAISEGEKSLLLNPNRPYAYNILGIIYTNLKQYDKSEQYFLKATQMNTTYEDAYNNLGVVYYDIKQYDKGKQYLFKAIKLDSTDEDAYYNIACIYSFTNDIPNAIKYLELSFVKGFNSYEDIQVDADLDNIRSTQEFKNLIKKYFPDKVK
jgi:Tfp pilus assembly protein PilF